jgi:hypothetical protein
MRTLLLLLCAAAALPAGDLRFQPAEGGQFRFDTGFLRGTLREAGKSAGLSAVVHIPSGAKLSRSMGLFSHYRVFSANHRYGTGAWDLPSEATLRSDGAVEVHWPTAEDRPFEMWAVYRWSGPATLDLETRVRPQTDLPGFEVFLASYFEEQFTTSLAYVEGHAATGNKPGFLAAEHSYGDWQMFPRSRDLLPLIQDGRWKIEPHPVDWTIMPDLHEPVGVRRDGRSGTAAILMAPPQDCFAIAMPYQTEAHGSLYLSLFGRTIKAQETARARARLVIADSPSDHEVERIYRTFLDALGR